MYKTMEQIEREYDGNWVFLINCKEDDYHGVAGGEVYLYNESMNFVLKNMDYNVSDGPTCVRYVGSIPEGVSLWL